MQVHVRKSAKVYIYDDYFNLSSLPEKKIENKNKIETLPTYPIFSNMLPETKVLFCLALGYWLQQ